MMEIDDLKTAWEVMNARAERQLTLQVHAYRGHMFDRVQGSLGRIVRGQIAQLIIGAIVAVLGASFWVEHREVLHLLVPGLMIHAYGIGMIIFAARTLYLVNSIDYAAPVVAIQKRLAALRGFYGIGAATLGVSWWFLWIAFLVVLMAAAGVDLWKHAPSVVVIGSAIGVVGTAATLGLYRRSQQPGASILARVVGDSLAPRSLRRAQSELAEIAEFERE
jgi:membrane-associated phospholipid phosphatase